MELLRQGQEEARKEREGLVNQNIALQGQVSDLSRKLDKITRELETSRQQQSEQRSWARVAAQPPMNTPPQSYRKQSGNSLRVIKISVAPPREEQDMPENQLKRDMPHGAAAKHISDALNGCDSTKGVEILGVGNTKTGYLIRFRTDRGKETADRNAEWVEKLGDDVKIIRPRYGVVVHLTPTEEVQIDSKDHSIEKIGQENDLTDLGYRIEDIAWMKKKDAPLGRHASLGIWFSSEQAAQHVVHNGLRRMDTSPGTAKESKDVATAAKNTTLETVRLDQPRDALTVDRTT
ncbi:hypothetical protein DBV05_g12667 [Lasiodiplodia theobromae]|uniref:Uncharacterized protein n=1 Tax=Lasiodiplodia theobromae TaxID=45133 RepID=A0A5N5CTI7_9PEZI|nr:hypothetical protein DBV05_g12667 [Lasiodiplodia theobromae]